MAFNTQGAMGGAMSGVSAGSTFGPWGALVGGVAGGAMGGFMGEDKEEDNTAAMLNAIMGKREYKLEEKAMKRVVDQLNQMRATGQNITPEMYDALYRAELQTAADTALKKSELGANIAMRSSSISENARQFDNQQEALGMAGLGELAGKTTQMMKENKQKTGSYCIIVTACHGLNSEEVDIAREFRNKFLDKETLRGYYIIANFLVPVMQASQRITEMVKYALVDSFLEYGRYILEMAPFCNDEAKEDTIGFLRVCRQIGKLVPWFIRSNGEVV